MDEEQKAARLLRGKNTPSVLERESIVDQILDEASPRKERARWLRYASMVFVAGAAATALLLTFRPPDELTPRAGQTGATLDMICQPGPTCTRGSRLLFRVSNALDEHGYIAAFAKRADGLVIWYFPQREAASSIAFSEGRWMDEGVVLAAAHEPGDYTIYALASQEPLPRARIRELVEAGGDENHPLLRAKLKVVP